MNDCVFCKIAKGEAPASIEYEDDNTVAFRSIDPAADVHILITPKKHIENFMNVGSDGLSQMKNAAQEIIREKNLEGGYKLIFNGGEYQAISHVHWHLLGGKIGDIEKT